MTAPTAHPARAFILGALIALVIGAPGCSWTEGPLRRHLILGVGIVDTGVAPALPPLRAEHSRAAGFLLAAGPVHTGLLLGLAERTTLEAPREAAALLSAAISPSDAPELRITALPPQATGSPTPPKESVPCASP